MRSTLAVAMGVVLVGLCGCSSKNGGAGGAGSGGGGGAGGSGGGGAGNGPGLDGGAGGGGGGAGSGGSGGTSGGWWKPTKNATFYWDLANAPPDLTQNVGVYDIDGWNNSKATVDALHAKGLKVVCYMDAGTYEKGRPDSTLFPAALKGNVVDGWPDENWLDVRPGGPDYSTLQSIMRARFQVCKDKGFDAVEPDNIDSWDGNNPGFPTTAADQATYNKWIATTVHGLGMAVFQKNDLGQIDDLIASFDGILDEQCNEEKECADLAPYVAAGKPAWDAEYKLTTADFCDADIKAGIIGAQFALDLNDPKAFKPCTNDVGKVQ